MNEGLLHMSVVDCSIHFWWKELLDSEMFWCVDYLGVQDVVSAHPGFANAGTNFPRFSVDKAVYRHKVPGNGRRRIVPS